MKIKKGNHEYKGMFWEWVLWQSDNRILFNSIVEKLLPYNKRLRIIFKDHYELKEFYYGI